MHNNRIIIIIIIIACHEIVYIYRNTCTYMHNYDYYMVTVVPRYGMDELHNYTLIELVNEQIMYSTIVV